jgi:hypothetical protein
VQIDQDTVNSDQQSLSGAQASLTTDQQQLASDQQAGYDTTYDQQAITYDQSSITAAQQRLSQDQVTLSTDQSKADAAAAAAANNAADAASLAKQAAAAQAKADADQSKAQDSVTSAESDYAAAAQVQGQHQAAASSSADEWSHQQRLAIENRHGEIATARDCRTVGVRDSVVATGPRCCSLDRVSDGCVGYIQPPVGRGPFDQPGAADLFADPLFAPDVPVFVRALKGPPVGSARLLRD